MAIKIRWIKNAPLRSEHGSAWRKESLSENVRGVKPRERDQILATAIPSAKPHHNGIPHELKARENRLNQIRHSPTGYPRSPYGAAQGIASGSERRPRTGPPARAEERFQQGSSRNRAALTRGSAQSPPGWHTAHHSARTNPRTG